MRIALLTTDTLPHLRFAQTMAERHDLTGVLVESTAMTAPFETAHPFEDRRDAFEKETWFDGAPPVFSDLAPTETFASLSTEPAAEALARLNADVAFVFGTGKLSGAILDVLKRRLVNLHCGEPQHYRGLDTDLWAVYHRDFDSLIATVQYVDPEVNKGAVLVRQPVILRRAMALHELRHAVTEAYVTAGHTTVKSFSAGSMVMVTPLHHFGRYYSFMPTALKSVCVDQFRRQTERLA